jgi:capsular polysaccharide biosynthesis protein
MNMLNFDQERRPPFQLEQGPDQLEQRSDFRTYYENQAIHALLSMRRQWFFIVSLVALAALAALIVIPLMPRKYTATALVVPSFYSQEQGKIVTLASVEATSIVNGEARLVLADTVLHAVVRRLWPERHPEAGSGSGWLRTMFLPETHAESPFDRQVTTLRGRLEVAKDARSYLISISTTASSADEAARIVNTVAVEYLRDKLVQRRRDAVIAAESELTRQRAVNGEKHPKVLQAVEALNAAQNGLTAVMAPDEGGRDTVRADEGIRLALPNRTPTSPKGTVILGLALMLGLLAGIGLAIWRDRRGIKPIDLALGRQLTARLRDRLVGVNSPLKTSLLQRIRVDIRSLLPRIRVDIRSHFSRRRQEIPCAPEHERPGCEASNDTTVPLPLVPAQPPASQTTVQMPLKLPKDNRL